MITIECDNCERTFEVDDEHAGGKVGCPHCGDVNRVPGPDAGVAAAAPATGPETRGLPPDSGPEQEICEIHPAMFRAHPFRYTGLVAVFAGGATLAVTALTTEKVKWMVWVGLLLCLAAVVGWVIWYLFASLWVKLSISNKRTVRTEGIIRRHTSEVLHDHVRNVEIRQNFLQRITNVGYLGISSSGQDGIEIEITDLPRPYELKELIDEYRDM